MKTVLLIQTINLTGNTKQHRCKTIIVFELNDCLDFVNFLSPSLSRFA